LPIPCPDPELWPADRAALPEKPGAAIVVIDGYLLSFDEHDRAAVTDPGGRLLRTIPLKVRRSHEFQALLRGRKDDRARGVRARRALEERMISGERICAEDLAWFVEDDAFAMHLRGLIAAPEDAPHNAGVLLSWDKKRGIGLLPLDYDARWIGWTAIEILHPMKLQGTTSWQDLLLDLKLDQPLSQAFREIRAIPLAERNLTESALLTGRGTRSAAAIERALLEEGWVPRRGNARRPMSVRSGKETTRLVAWFDYGQFIAPGDPTRTGAFGFLLARTREPIPLGAVPKVLASEAIRSLEVCLAQAGAGKSHARGADKGEKTIFTSRLSG
jgi:hypothetical protein